MMMQRRQIPKQASFSQLNANIAPFGNELIDIPTQLTEWPSAMSSNAMAMVTNYGAAGSNAAIVIKQHAQSSNQPTQSCQQPSEVPIIVAANSAESLRSYCKTLISYMRHARIGRCVDLAYNLASKQNRDHEYRLSFPTPSDDVATLVTMLESSAQQATIAKKQTSARLPVILCFGGQNGDTAHISEDLFNKCELLQYHLVRPLFLSLLQEISTS
jgi:acyl transferase domain-containing protein